MTAFLQAQSPQPAPVPTTVSLQQRGWAAGPRATDPQPAELSSGLRAPGPARDGESAVSIDQAPAPGQ